MEVNIGFGVDGCLVLFLFVVFVFCGFVGVVV